MILYVLFLKSVYANLQQCKSNEILYPPDISIDFCDTIWCYCIPKYCYENNLQPNIRQTFSRIITLDNKDIAVDLIYTEKKDHPFAQKDDPGSCVIYELRKFKFQDDYYGLPYDTEIISTYDYRLLERTWRFLIKREDIATTLQQNPDQKDEYFGKFRYRFFFQEQSYSHIFLEHTINFVTEINNIDKPCISEACQSQVNTSLTFCLSQAVCNEQPQSLQLYRNQNVTIQQTIQNKEQASFYLLPRHVQIIGNGFYKIINKIYYQQKVGSVIVTFNLDFNYDKPFQIQITSQLSLSELNNNFNGVIQTAISETLDCIKENQFSEGCVVNPKLNGNLQFINGENINLIIIILFTLII